MSRVWRRISRWAWRPRPGILWRVAALWVVPALLLLATILPAVLLAGRLPELEGPPYGRHPMDPTGLAWLAGVGVGAAWAALVIVYLSLRFSGMSRQHLWRLGVPLLYFGAGLAIAWVNSFVAINLDGPYTAPPASPGTPGQLMECAAGLLVGACGVALGRRAADSDRDARPRPASRAIWISEVRPSAGWWLIRSVAPLVMLLFFVGSFGLVGAPGAGLATGLMVSGFQALPFLLASSNQIVLTPDGIRVRYGHLRMWTSVTTIDQIESIDVTTVRLLKLRAAWFGMTQLLVRDGPALVVRTRWGERRWFTLPEAEEAAVLLRRWKAQREAAVAAWYGQRAPTT